MSLISVLVFLVVLAVVAYVAYWIITKFLPEPARTPSLAIVGILLLLILLAQFVPGIGSYKVWH